MFTSLELKTVFDPAIHGFKFTNKKIEYELLHRGGKHGKNLCGGMIYAALDNFLFLHTIPRQTDPPLIGSSLNSYIYKRQTDAHRFTVTRFSLGISWFVDRFKESVTFEFDKIRKKVEAHFPVPLFLVGEGLMHGHHVLIIGCESSPSLGKPINNNAIFDVYDPNFPNEITSIAAKHSEQRFQLIGPGGSDRGYLQGFFVDMGYEKQLPPW